MSLKLKDIVGNIFHKEEQEKAEEERRTAEFQNKLNQVLGTKTSANNAFNPFVKSNGELLNPYLNYQKLLDSPSISQTAKRYITQATGLTPTVATTQQQTSSAESTQQTPSVDSTQQTTSTSTTQQSTATPSTQVNSSTQSVKNSDSNIVTAAKKYIGTPYVWGGESMSEGGMDCSGFVYNALKDAGYEVGRTTAQGYRNSGTVVSKSDMQPGDLIFFGDKNNASHIGIYVGNGQMIHSTGRSNNTKDNPGKGVIISSVNNRSDFIEARRY